jgi:hypothetical protein
MWKQLWQKWTIDKPAAFGDWLWQTFVVELAALLDRLTLRQVIALIPVVILVVAYAHSIPLPPELMLVGDLLAYIDVFSMILLISLLGRVSTVLCVIRQASEAMLRLARRAHAKLRRPDSRRRRKPDAATIRRLIGGAKNEDDGGAADYGMAWA